MKHLIICISIFFIFTSCENNTEDKVAIQFKGYVNFVDSIEKFNEVYKNTPDTEVYYIPLDPNDPDSPTHPDTIIGFHKSLFVNSSKFGSDIISFYMLKSSIIDSMDNANCFTQEQRNELRKAKKKFDKMIADGASGN